MTDRSVTPPSAKGGQIFVWMCEGFFFLFSFVFKFWYTPQVVAPAGGEWAAAVLHAVSGRS